MHSSCITTTIIITLTMTITILNLAFIGLLLLEGHLPNAKCFLLYPLVSRVLVGPVIYFGNESSSLIATNNNNNKYVITSTWHFFVISEVKCH